MYFRAAITEPAPVSTHPFNAPLPGTARVGRRAEENGRDQRARQRRLQHHAESRKNLLVGAMQFREPEVAAFSGSRIIRSWMREPPAHSLVLVV
jgi:hypothetical protein